MFSPFDQNQPRMPNNHDGNSQEAQRFSHQNADSGHNGFNQKLLSENGADGRIEVPGDIKILFETGEDRFSDIASSTGVSNWDRSEGDRTPVGLFHRPPTLKSSSFKVTSSTSYNQRNNLLNKQRVTFSPKLTSTQSSQITQKLGNGFLNIDRLRENRPNSYSPPPKKFSDASEETLSIKKVSAGGLKISNCNNVCPFCNKIVQNTDNPDATYAYENKGTLKNYLVHSECNPALNNSPTFPKISVHSDIAVANIAESTFCSAINSIDTLPDYKKTYFLKLEAFHPISSSKLFRLERSCNEICTTIDENQFLYVNFDSQNSSLLELNNYTFPFNEFRMAITVYQTHSNEDAYSYDFNVDLSNPKITEGSNKKSLDISYSQTGNCDDVTLGIDYSVISSKDEFLRKLNKPQYFQTDSKNTLVSLKYLAISLPLKRIQLRPILKSFNENPSHFAKESQLSYGSLTGKSNRLRVFKGNDDDSRIDSLDSVNNIENNIGGSMPGLTFLPPSQNFNHQQTLQPEIPSLYNTKTSLTADNSPNNKKPTSPSSRMPFSPARFDPSTSFSAALSNSETLNPENNNTPSKQTEDIDSEFKLDENLDKLVSMARTYRGSKVLQDFLVKASKTDLDKIIGRFAHNMIELMLDPYANYMIQILAKHCQPEQRLVLLQKIAPAMYKIACDKKGTYALQTIVSLINTHAEDLLMKSALGNYVLDLALDIQGNHVIQKLINAVSYKNIDFIYQPLVENFLHVSTHSSGSLVFKQLIIKVEKNVNMKTTIIHLVCQEMENLVQDPYGNYVIQYALEYYPKDCISIQQKIINKLIPYSSQKFSSNIIEKSLAVGDYFFRKKVAGEILKNDRLSDLLKNKYGNYVILHTLAICDSEDKQFIMQGIHRCVYSFQGTKYKLRWIKFLDDNPLNIQWKALSPSSKSPFNRGNNTQFESFNDLYNSSTENPTVGVINRDEDLQKLEIVKKIWRDMNKEEKRDGTPHNGKAHSNKSFGGYEDFSDSTNGSPIHGNYDNGNYYPEQFNLYLSPTKMDDQRMKWY